MYKCKATLIIYIHIYPFSGGCNGTTSDQGRHKLLQAPVNMGEMSENLGKSSNTIYYNSMASIYTKEVKLNSAWDACSQMHGGNVSRNVHWNKISVTCAIEIVN